MLVTGAREQDHRRLELARDFGADLVVDVLEEDPRAALKRATGGLADVVGDVTANAPRRVPAGHRARPAPPGAVHLRLPAAVLPPLERVLGLPREPRTDRNLPWTDVPRS